MTRAVIFLTIVLVTATSSPGAVPSDVADMLDRCTTNLDRFDSWTIKGEVLSERQWGSRKDPNTVTHLDLRSDDTRVYAERRLWLTYDTDANDYERAKDNCVRIVWDGKLYKKYYKGEADDSGSADFDDFNSVDAESKDYEIATLRYRHELCYATGYALNSFDRIDKLLREAKIVSLREDTEQINGFACHVIDAQTSYGNLTVWLDPEHSYGIAKHHIEARRKAGHLQFGRPMQPESVMESCEVTRFARIDGVWIGVEATRRRHLVGQEMSTTEDAHLRITDFVRHPDHEELHSFDCDIPEGTLVVLVPITHIQYVWRDGELIKHVDDEVVAQIDAILATMIDPGDDAASPPKAAKMTKETPEPVPADPNNASTLARKTNPWLRPRAHCGLYCIYSLLKLGGRDVDFRDLVVPEYFGRLLGSSMAELTQAANDYGLHAGVAARISAKALRQSPYPAILHVKADPNVKDYDHYALYLGTEKGKAKLFSPPEEPKLVDFAELAPLWDGYALFVSERPFDIDALFQPDRQRLYFYGMSVVLFVLIAHVVRRLWLLFVPALSRRMALGLTVGQTAIVGLAALLAGSFYHFAHDEGFLANPGGAKGVQKAHAGGFIPKISEKKARKMLGGDAVVIDARLTPDYERGHIEEAISLPVDANDAVWEATIPTIPRGRPIVAYCQSAGCKFAEKVSLKLIDEGFDDIAIFKGGWVEWVQKHGRPTEPRKEVEQDADNDPTI